MTAVRIYFLFLCVAFTEIAAWTVDLSEYRKHLYAKKDVNIKDNVKNKVNSSLNGEFFDNKYGDSPHNTHLEGFLGPSGHIHYDYQNEETGRYADEYGYQGYLEKETNEIVRDGSEYLEGLKAAIEQFGELLMNCSERFGDNILNPIQDQISSTNPTTWLPQNETPIQSTPRTLDRDMCARATASREHVRRLAQLALWATTELQDRSYRDGYHKPTPDEGEEEKELLLRLAWFLERLSHLTGFEPRVHYLPVFTTKEPTTTPPPLSLVQVSEDVKMAMINCLKGPGNEPATERCRVSSPIAPRPVLDQGNSASTTTASASATADLSTSQTQLSHFPLTPPVNNKSVRKRSIDENPLQKVVQYFLKYKVWAASNPEAVISIDELKDFDVNNNLRPLQSKQKRSIDSKKYSYLKLPENPVQDISDYVKHKSRVHYFKDDTESEKIKLYLSKIRGSTPLTAKENVRKLHKIIKRFKRSSHYEKKFLPRTVQNPMQDISYYVKNKSGTEIRDNLAQAAMVRADLERIFQNPNIEEVRRYGANYNPAVLDTVVAGFALTRTDD